MHFIERKTNQVMEECEVGIFCMFVGICYGGACVRTLARVWVSIACSQEV